MIWKVEKCGHLCMPTLVDFCWPSHSCVLATYACILLHELFVIQDSKKATSYIGWMEVGYTSLCSYNILVTTHVLNFTLYLSNKVMHHIVVCMCDNCKICNTLVTVVTCVLGNTYLIHEL